MKKLIKNLVIIILVLGAVGGTAWFFFSKLTEQRDSYTGSINYQYSASNTEFFAQLKEINTLSGCDRFSTLIEVETNLNQISEVLVPYLSKAEDTDVDQNKIYSYLQTTKNMQPSLKSMFNEYEQKATNVATFDKNAGANPVYKKLCNYNVQYAKYLKSINRELGNVVNRDADVKFYVIEIYLNVVIDTLSTTEDKEGVTLISKPQNLTEANKILNFSSAYINNFSEDVNLFKANYKKCNRYELAVDFATNFNLATTLTDDVNNNALFFLRKLAGVI